MKCSFVVSVYDRPLHLRCVLASLEIQTERDFEVIVTDNAMEPGANTHNLSVTEEFIHRDQRFRYLRTALPGCYHSAEGGAQQAVGEYLCFPSDDSYYVPTFLSRMLSPSPLPDLIYCDCLYGNRKNEYLVLSVLPSLCRIDKGGFLIRREFFLSLGGFRAKEQSGDRCMADGLMIEAAVKKGATKAKVPGILWCHNP